MGEKKQKLVDKTKVEAEKEIHATGWKAKKEQKKELKKEIERPKTVVRILNKDIDGGLPVYKALTKLPGINFSFSNAVCNVSNIAKTKKLIELEPKILQKIEDVIKSPTQHNIPVWLLNRRFDYVTGTDKHLLGTDLKFANEMDIKLMKAIKCYKGIRHALNLPVRGQRTKAHFRKGKTIGVLKKAKLSAK